MSLFEAPERIIKAIQAEGMESQWIFSLGLPSAKARQRAMEKILEEIMQKRWLGAPREEVRAAAQAYLEVGPLLAEHKAISKAAAKLPMVRDAAPEILTEYEAIELAKLEHPFMTHMEQTKLILLLKGRMEMRTWAEPDKRRLGEY